MWILDMTEAEAKALLNSKATCFFAPILPPFSVRHSNNGPVGTFMCNKPDAFIASTPVTQYSVGDIIAIKEPWRAIYPTIPGWTRIEYQAGGIKAIPDVVAMYEGNDWKPADTLPDEAIRQHICVTNVTIKRIQDVTVEDILTSGLDVEMPPICRQSIHPDWPPENERIKYDTMTPAQQEAYLQSRARATYIGWCEYADKLLNQFAHNWNLSVPAERIDDFSYQANPFIYHVKFEKRSIVEYIFEPSSVKESKPKEGTT